MYAVSHSFHVPRSAARNARPVSTRAAFGIWALTSIGGWLVIVVVLRALGAF